MWCSRKVSLKWFRAVGTVSRFLYDGQIQQSLSVFGTLTDGKTKSQPGRGGAAERDASMVGRKVENVQGSSSFCKVRRIPFSKRICKWWIGFIVNVIM